MGTRGLGVRSEKAMPVDATETTMAQRFESSEEADARRTSALMGFIVVLLLAIAGILLVRELGNKSRLEDCLMSGRKNCAPIEVPLRRP